MGAQVQQMSPFVEGVYKADRNVLKHYHRQAALFLSKVYNWDEDYLLELMQQIFVPNENGFKEAKFRVFEKNKHGDRVPVVMPAREFFTKVEENNWHLSPSLVAYKNSNEEQSVNASGTEIFIDHRRLYKHKRSEVPKHGELYTAFNEIQNALKIFNNAQSGGMSSSGTPLFNKSGHTSLTSTTRALTSTANLTNERLITGNRLLLSYNRTMEYFIAQLKCADQKLIQEVITENQLNYATVDQVFDMVRRCTHYYWRNESKLQAIKLFLESLNKLELTILLCCMDLRGLYTTNPVYMKQFFAEWAAVPKIPEDAVAEDFPKPGNGDYKNLCVTKLPKGAKALAMNHLNAHHVALEFKYGKFIKAFLKSRIPPTGLFDVKELVRESVVTSDTDSSIYSVDLIIDDIANGPDSILALNGVLTYFIRCIAVDQHARLSKNMNVANKYLYRLNMKNEFLFASYVTTSMSKHYFALQLMVEGVLNDEPDLELKGVHLRGVKIALKVREFTNKLMRDILDALYDRRQLDAAQLLHEVGNIERNLIKDIEEGGYTWLTKNGIKEESAYSTPDSSIYFYHEMWEQVFAEKYGKAPELPYKAYKVNLDLSNKTKIKRFFDAHRSNAVVARLESFISARSSLTSAYIPTDLMIALGGIPEEILPIVDVRLLISQNFKSIYAILETLGLFIMNSKTTRLVSDEH
jgi:hypothetical protein